MTTTTAPPPTVATGPAVQGVTVRPLQAGDGLHVRRLFRTGLPVGRRLALAYADIMDYERQCLDWYLTRGRPQARVAEVDGRIVGYLLPCLDHRSLDLRAGQRALRWSGRATYRWGVGRLGREGRRFVQLRLQDEFEARRDPTRRPYPVSALLAGRDAAVERALIAAGDEIATRADSPGWSYDVDVRDPASLATLGEPGSEVALVTVHRTSSWLADTPVWRVTLARTTVPSRSPATTGSR